MNVRPGRKVYFRSPYMRSMQPAAAAASWWLSGGIAAANCLAAYTPKGAASLAASYDNNAAPGNGLADGTYDCTATTPPLWNAATGWDNSAGGWLSTNLIPNPNQTWSMFVRFTDAVAAGGNCAIADVYVSRLGNSCRFGFYSYVGGATLVRWENGDVSASGLRQTAPGLAAGTMAFAGKNCYRNGVADGAIPAAAGTNALDPLPILARSIDAVTGTLGTAKVQYLSVYNTTISTAQVLALHNATA